MRLFQFFLTDGAIVTDVTDSAAAQMLSSGELKSTGKTQWTFCGCYDNFLFEIFKMGHDFFLGGAPQSTQSDIYFARSAHLDRLNFLKFEQFSGLIGIQNIQA